MPQRRRIDLLVASRTAAATEEQKVTCHHVATGEEGSHRNRPRKRIRRSSACLYCSFRELKKDLSYSDVNQPLRLYIDRKQIFQAAAQRLNLSVTQEVAIQIYPDDFVGKIIVLGIHGSNISENNAKEFYGNFKSNANEAIQSAYDEAIIFLVNKKSSNYWWLQPFRFRNS